jgi:tetratricopeptide (TPR) repeat protein
VLDEAATLLQDSLGIYRANSPVAGAEVARVLGSLGAVRRAQGDLDEAERLQRDALGIRRAVGGPDDLDVAESLNNLAIVLQSRGRSDDALPLLRDALRIRRLRWARIIRSWLKVPTTWHSP